MDISGFAAVCGRRIKSAAKSLRDIAARRPEAISVALCIIMALMLGITVPRYFFSSHNLNSLATATAPEGIVALGMMMLLISGVFDLSVGSVMCLGGLVAAIGLSAGFPTPVALALGLGSGLVIGLFNGLITEVAGVNPLITTIGMMYIVRGITEITLVKRGKAGYGNFPADFRIIGQGKIFGVPFMFWLLLLFAVLFAVFLISRRGGRRIYLIGGNEAAAAALGVKKRKIRIILFMLAGILAALAGILINARAGAANRYTGQNSHLNVIIACIIGGGSLAGGKGNMGGAVFGTLFLVLLNNAFNLYQVNQHVQSLVNGMVLLAVVVVDGYMNIIKRRELGKE
ncbi:MAG: ABC transporter permease [Treponema sp.]|jgi:ribose/xylose/arabinose/galactoside ABC-type transport system permease subunit|nr:ABC transporter permease [Treponema sp.]